MPFGEAAITTYLYLILVGAFYLAIVITVAAPVCLFRHRFGLRPSFRALWRVLAFLSLLLVVGGVAQFVWTTAIWGRFYYSTDYVYGYMPLLPMTQRIIDFQFASRRGALNGISLTTLNLIWLAFTIPVWALTIQIYRRLFRVSPAPPATTAHLSPA